MDLEVPSEGNSEPWLRGRSREPGAWLDVRSAPSLDSRNGADMHSPSRILLLLTPLLLLAGPVRGQAGPDSAAIRATALDYIEGWYEGDAYRMERALHPHLAKRFLEEMPDGGLRLTDTSALELVQQVRAGGGSSVPAEALRTEVTILDVFQDAASVRVDAHGWIDYMHLARLGDEWKIVNVLWEIREAEE